MCTKNMRRLYDLKLCEFQSTYQGSKWQLGVLFPSLRDIQCKTDIGENEYDRILIWQSAKSPVRAAG